jgi:hypothetical protein
MPHSGLRPLAPLVIASILVGVGCGGSLSDQETLALQRRLRDALTEPVATRDKRDEHSRLLAEIADKGVLDGLNQTELRAKIGAGIACRHDMCDDHGFTDADWYYEIGTMESEDVKQLPVLIIGFDPRGRAVRVWTLTTH